MAKVLQMIVGSLAMLVGENLLVRRFEELSCWVINLIVWLLKVGIELISINFFHHCISTSPIPSFFTCIIPGKSHSPPDFDVTTFVCGLLPSIQLRRQSGWGLNVR